MTHSYTGFVGRHGYCFRYDENSSSPYMERVKRAQLGSERLEGVPIFRNSGRTRPELRNCFFGGSYSRGTAGAEPGAYHMKTPNGVAPPHGAERKNRVRTVVWRASRDRKRPELGSDGTNSNRSGPNCARFTRSIYGLAGLGFFGNRATGVQLTAEPGAYHTETPNGVFLSKTRSKKQSFRLRE